AGQSGVQGDPSGVTAHHLHDQDPHVGLGGGVQPVDGLGGDVDGGVEAEGVVGGGQVGVDGLGDAHAGGAVLLGEERGRSEGVLAADGDEGVDLPPPQGVLDAADAVLLVQRVGAGGAEDGAAAGQDAADGRYAEGDGAVLQRAPPAVPEAGEGVAVLLDALADDGPDDGVEAGAVAAPGQYSDAHGTVPSPRMPDEESV